MNRTRKHISAHFSQRGKQTTSPNGWRSRSRKNRKLRSLDFRWTAGEVPRIVSSIGRAKGIDRQILRHVSRSAGNHTPIYKQVSESAQTTQRAPPEEDVKEIFLATLREPLRTTLVVLDFKTSTIDQVIYRVLDMDRAQNGNHLSMRALQQALSTKEDLRFRLGIQCTTCLNPGHSSLECTMRMHCALCHSKAHTIEWCQYNILNRQVALVTQIEPHEERQPEEDRFRREDRFHQDDYPRDHYDRDHTPEYDQRKGGERSYQVYNQCRNQNYRRGYHNRRNEHRE